MSFYNMPAGCLGPSDLDHYAALGLEEEQCQGCKLAVSECECCRECGATPDQACEEWCGRLDNMNYDYPDDEVEPPHQDEPERGDWAEVTPEENHG